jgi:aspartyl-tRNA(Asn)/glutamyl-tRNA(Gln) amidotransferase subunit C
MSVDKATVVRIAHLARLHVPDDRLDRLAGELGDILGWVEQLNEVDTAGVEPMVSGVQAAGLRRREDRVTDGGYADRVLANAPAARDGFYVVPRVVE